MWSPQRIQHTHGLREREGGRAKAVKRVMALDVGALVEIVLSDEATWQASTTTAVRWTRLGNDS
jgi:hypothetical protein